MWNYGDVIMWKLNEKWRWEAETGFYKSNSYISFTPSITTLSHLHNSTLATLLTGVSEA